MISENFLRATAHLTPLCTDIPWKTNPKFLTDLEERVNILNKKTIPEKIHQSGEIYSFYTNGSGSTYLIFKKKYFKCIHSNGSENDFRFAYSFKLQKMVLDRRFKKFPESIRDRAISFFNREREALNALSDVENVIHPYDFYNYDSKSTKLGMFIKWYKQGDLMQMLEEKSQDLTPLINEIIKTLARMHYRGIFHRDLKGNNIFVKKNFTPIIGDFGAACEDFSDHLKIFCGTIPYLAPEAMIGGMVTEKVDIWSLGILMYTLTRKTLPPFLDALYDIDQQKHVITRKRFFLMLEGVEQFISIEPPADTIDHLIWRTLIIDPNFRPSAFNLLSIKDQQEIQEDYLLKNESMAAAAASQ